MSGTPGRLRGVLGYLPQELGVYPKLTAREFLRYLAAARGLAGGDRTVGLLSMVGLREAADRKLETFSGRMRQRVGIAQALLNDPELQIVDEPPGPGAEPVAPTLEDACLALMRDGAGAGMRAGSAGRSGR